MEKLNNMCPECKVRTVMYKEPVAHGRYILKCCGCECKMTYEADGTKVPIEQIREEEKQWEA
jgi:transcription initiation factor TFIIIB Brf1 subunit/transcription initiation factor TFIIB